MKASSWSVVALVLACLSQQQCATTIFRKTFTRDQSLVSIGAGSFFNQRAHPPEKNWQGDWVLRRERLHLIDEELLKMQPDILVLQETMARTGSAFDSDQRILRAGSLADYVWSNAAVKYYPDTDEEEYISVVSKQAILKERTLAPSQLITPAHGGALALQVIHLYNQAPLTVAHLTLPQGASDEARFLAQVKSQIDTFLKQEHLCEERLVLAGILPREKSKNFQDFLKNFRLKDSVPENCLLEDCPNPHPTNLFFQVSKSGEADTRSARIYVPISGTLVESTVLFSAPQDSGLFVDSYGISSLWPTAHYGWMTRLKFSSCP
jgi:hypothetical protein